MPRIKISTEIVKKFESIFSIVPHCTVEMLENVESIDSIPEKEKPTVLILPFSSQSLALCSRMKSNVQQKSIPIIMYLEQDSESAMIEGMEAGADLFLTSPLDETDALAKLNLALRLSKAEADLQKEKKVLKEYAHDKALFLASNTKWFKHLMDVAVHGIYILDQDGILLYVNDKIKNQLQNDQPLGKSINDIFAGDFLESVSTNLAMVIMTCMDASFENNVTIDNKNYWFRTSMQPIHDDHEHVVGVLCFQIDITERKQAEEARRNYELRLANAKKLDTIGTLMGGIAHDFNNLLTPIVGFTDMALATTDEEDPVFDKLTRIMKAADRTKQLVHHILTFSHQDEQKRNKVNIPQVIENVREKLADLFPQSISVETNVAENLPIILGDEKELTQMLMNLGSNAYQAMENKGGVLSIIAKSVTIDDSDDGLESGEYQCITVKDTGVGIPEKFLNQIFVPFFSINRDALHQGLGLSEVQGIVTSHGGRIFVKSEMGVGTEFTIYLPISTREKISVEQKSKLAKGTERIFLIDDEEDIALMAKEMLEKLGYTVQAETDSVRALEILTEKHSEFDLVVTDQVMPNLTGTDIAEKLATINPKLPIILITGFCETVTADNREKYGFKDYLMKPVLISDLSQSIRAVLDKKN